MFDESNNLIDLTTEIVTAHVSKNNVALGELPRLIQSVHQALAGLQQGSASPVQLDEPQRREPAIGIKASVKPDYLVCMVCGAKQRTLKRHLAAAHQLTPKEYRDEFGLKPEYPMTAPAYSEHRRGMAHAIGLGRKPDRAEAGTPEGAEAGASENNTLFADPAPADAPMPKKGRRKLTIAA